MRRYAFRCDLPARHGGPEGGAPPATRPHGPHAPPPACRERGPGVTPSGCPATLAPPAAYKPCPSPQSPARRPPGSGNSALAHVPLCRPPPPRSTARTGGRGRGRRATPVGGGRGGDPHLPTPPAAGPRSGGTLWSGVGGSWGSLWAACPLGPAPRGGGALPRRHPRLQPSCKGAAGWRRRGGRGAGEGAGASWGGGGAVCAWGRLLMGTQLPSVE